MPKKRDARDYSAILKNAQTQVNNTNSSNSKQKDERFWQLARDKEGNGFAIIRFLPDRNPQGMPFKTNYKHAFTLENKLFIDKCPTTIGEQCPVCDWNKDQPSDWVKDESKSYRKKSFISNILVISDPGNKENEGKVFLFEFGQQIFTKLKEKLSPSYPGEEPLIYFHPEEGANFKVKVKKDGVFATWNPSEFDGPSDITSKFDFTKIEEDLYDLEKVISENSYKTYDEMQNKLNKYLKMIGYEDVANNPDIETNARKQEAQEYVNKKKNVSPPVENDDESESSDDEKEESNEFSAYFDTLKKK